MSDSIMNMNADATKSTEIFSFGKFTDSFQSIDSTCTDDGDDYDSESDYSNSSSSSCGSVLDDEELLTILANAHPNVSSSSATSDAVSGEIRRSTSLPSLLEAQQGAELSTLQVNMMLNQVRVRDQAKRRSSLDVRSQNVVVEHIQGVSMKSDENAFEELDELQDVLDPAELYMKILAEAGLTARVIPFSEVKGFFLEITERRVSSYTKDVIAAVKSGDIDFLRTRLLEQKHDLNCCNRFGESVLHTACRHGAVQVVQFLLEEAHVDVRVVDDFGRTPFHDAAWQAEPKMELVELLLLSTTTSTLASTSEQDRQSWPDMLLIADARGCTPLQYVRKSQWRTWVKLLEDHRATILPKVLLV